MGIKKILVVFGTRPEAIKMAPLVLKLKEEKQFKVVVCVTAQHRELLDEVLELFKIKPDYDLNIMQNGQSLSEIASRVLSNIDWVLEKENPQMMLVHGDTTTTLSSALAAFYHKIPIGHVEAGLRTGNMYLPYPEEMNRKLTGGLATVHFAPTFLNRTNLVSEGVHPSNIYVTGNTVIDALYMIVGKNRAPVVSENGRRAILLTCHRRENWGKPMKNVFQAVRDLVDQYPDIEVFYPVHPNPYIKTLAAKYFQDTPRVTLLSHLNYAAFCELMNRCYLVLTDSGGLQEEAPALGKPVLVLRDETERPEALRHGTVRLAGTERAKIVTEAARLLSNPKIYERMARVRNPYGDGTASDKIVSALKERLYL